MKSLLTFALCTVSFAAFQAGAATATLKSQESDGFRRTCTYAFKGRTESVFVADAKDCPLEHEIDLIPTSDSKGKRSNRAGRGQAEFAGELDQGATKSCAYRRFGSTIYRTIRSNQSCPVNVDL